MTANLAQVTLRAYERWAPIYPPVAHNPLMRVEESAMQARWPEISGRRALDLACGSGRYTRLLAQAGARHVVAMDFCEPMLKQVKDATRVCGNMMSLPFAGGVFDVVISGLALGHASDVRPWMREIARVLTPGGTLLYSDFHPEAARAGLTRSFKDQDNQTCTVPHHCFDPDLQREALTRAGMQIQLTHEVRVGDELREPFARCEEFYSRWHGLPIVLIVRARKPALETT
jgi:ubiquinone/menaquinone biosynthesis C-methylase UbiE